MRPHRALLFCLSLALFSASTGANAQSDDSYHAILFTERSVSAVKLLSDELVDSRYILLGITRTTTERGKPNRMRTDDIYAFDCKSPRRFKAISLRINQAKLENDPDIWINMKPEDVPERFRIQDLDYSEIDEWNRKINQEMKASGTALSLPEMLSVSAEYGCTATSMAPAKRNDLRENISRSGAQSDIQELVCEYSLDKDKTYTADVGFSEANKTIRWNDRWMHGAYVRERELGINGQKMVASIDRRTGAIRVTIANLTAKGTCEPSKVTMRKF